jgi:uncharacterized damage-inducible protein DinB
MAEISQLKTLFAYSFDTVQRLAAGARELNKEELHSNPGYGRGSIHDLLIHLLSAASSWRIALETGQQPEGIKAEQYPDLDSLQQAFEEESSAWQAYLASLDEGAVSSEIELTTRRGMKRTFARWKIIYHLLLHGMQHHAELAQLLTERGHSPGDLDFIFYR